MKTIIVQVRDGNTWSKVTTVQYDPNRSTNKRIGDTTYYSRAGAIQQAMSWMQEWVNSDQFTGRKMRIGEYVAGPSWPKAFQVITGVGA